jgi:hypothetical protein
MIEQEDLTAVARNGTRYHAAECPDVIHSLPVQPLLWSAMPQHRFGRVANEKFEQDHKMQLDLNILMITFIWSRHAW